MDEHTFKLLHDMTGLSIDSHEGKPVLFILILERRLILFPIQNY